MIALILSGALATSTPAPVMPKTTMVTSQTQAVLQAQIVKAASGDVVQRMDQLATLVLNDEKNCPLMATDLQSFHAKSVGAASG